MVKKFSSQNKFDNIFLSQENQKAERKNARFNQLYPKNARKMMLKMCQAMI